MLSTKAATKPMKNTPNRTARAMIAPLKFAAPLKDNQ